MAGVQPPRFEIAERRDSGGTLWLQLVGEFDFVVADQLSERLAELKRSVTPVRLDLSKVRFMDSTGLRVVVSATLDAQRDGWELEVDPRVSAPVARLLELVQADKLLWPARGREDS